MIDVNRRRGKQGTYFSTYSKSIVYSVYRRMNANVLCGDDPVVTIMTDGCTSESTPLFMTLIVPMSLTIGLY